MSNFRPWQTQDECDSSLPLNYRFVARQPIFDRDRRTFGYELLFRDSWHNSYSGEPDASTKTIIDNTLVFGLDSLVDDAFAFINCTYSVLVEEFATLLPCGTVLEILEDVPVDEQLLLACQRLRNQGYRIALDDFDFSSRWDPLLPIADFIKVDFLRSTREQRRSLVEKLGKQPTQFLAEKIEHEADFQAAFDEGFDFFQGYFFARPVVVARPAFGVIAQRLQLLDIVRSDVLRTEQIVSLLKRETSIALRLLRLANSAAAASRERIIDLRTALAMVGQERFRQLAITALIAEVAVSSVPELQKSLLQRARYCEEMAPSVGHDKNELFFFGIFSLLQPILRLSRREISETVPLSPSLLDALFGTFNRIRSMLDSLLHFEKGDWKAFASDAARLALPEKEIARSCLHAQTWASQMIRCNTLSC